MSQGFVIMAQNTSEVDYVKCAETLALSIHKVMPHAKVSVITNDTVNYSKFDQVITLPYGDLDINGKWKLINDWQVYEASPYDETIKLESDMVIPRDIMHWFGVCCKQDIVLCTTIRNLKQEISTVRGYRRFIDENKLPDVYNAITYFKKSETAKIFFEIVRNVFENWDDYKSTLKCNPQEPVSTDWAYSIAAHIIGKEKTIMPSFTEMSMVHMKQFINGNSTENWTDTFIYECLPNQIRIQTVPQLYPLHYHIKNFCDKIIRGYA
jgi:hypothetical protein